MRIKKPVSLLLALLSSVLVPLALPNEFITWGSPILGLIALVPLFIMVCLADSPKTAFWCGAVYGFLFQAISSFWLWYFKDFRLWTLGSTCLVYFVVYSGLCAWLSLAAHSAPRWRAMLIPIGWVAYEFLKSTGFLSFPYGLISYSWNNVLGFDQMVDVTGVYGPSFILALSNMAIAELVMFFMEGNRLAVRGFPRRRVFALFAMCIACFVLAMAYGKVKLAETNAVAKEFKAILVQPNEDSWSMHSEHTRLLNEMALTRSSLEQLGAKADIILWTETSIDLPYDYVNKAGVQHYAVSPSGGQSLRDFIRANGTPFLTGMPHVYSWDPLLLQNSVGLVGSDGELVGTFAKIHCVPFAEAIPFWEYDWMKRFMAKVVGMDGGWTVGTDYEIFSIPLSSGQRLNFASPICFEISYDDECRIFSNLGADVLLNLTNVSWSQTVSAEIQHTVTARYRAIENRKPVVLSTNGGLSCWFDEKGVIHEPLPFFTPASRPITVSTRPEARPTVYDAAGNSMAVGMVFFFVIFSGIAILYLRFTGRKDLGYGSRVLGKRG